MSDKLVAVSQPSTLYQLLEVRLSGSLAEYVADHRASLSWREIAERLTGETGVAVSAEALRLWFADKIVTETRVAP